jgi:prophage regulatory protein
MSDPFKRQAPHAQFEISQKNAKLLRRPEVEARTGLSRSTLYEWMKRGEFPQPVKLGARIVAWRESDVTDWLESRETRGAA